MAAARGHTTPAHAALALRRAHAACGTTAGPSGARRGTGRCRPPAALRSPQVRAARPGPAPRKGSPNLFMLGSFGTIVSFRRLGHVASVRRSEVVIEGCARAAK